MTIGENENNFIKSKKKISKICFFDSKCVGYWANTKIVMCQISRIFLSLKC